MKRFICLVLLVSCVFIVNAQDDGNVQLVVPQIYDNIKLFEDGLFVVENGKKKGVVDIKGKIVVPVQYDGVSIGKKNGRDKKKDYGGLIIVSKTTNEKDDFGNFKEEYGLYDKNGKELVPVGSNYISVNYGMAEIGRKSVMLPDRRIIGPFDDICILNEEFVKVSEDRESGVINRNGNTIIPIGKFNNVYESKNKADLLSVEGPFQNGKREWGLYNKDGKVVIPVGKYESIDVETNCIIVKQNGKEGALNFDGDVIVPIGKFEGIREKDCGDLIHKYIEVTSNGKRGVIDQNGKTIIPIGKYDNYNFWDNTFAIVKLNEKKGAVDGNGIEIIPFGKYEFLEMKYGVLYTSRNGKYGIIDENGNELPIEYDIITPNKYSYGVAFVKKDGKIGLADKNGKEIIPPIYDDIRYNGGNMLFAQKDNEIIFYNVKGDFLMGSEKWAECNNKYGTLKMLSDDVYFIATAKNGKKGVVKLW